MSPAAAFGAYIGIGLVMATLIIRYGDGRSVGAYLAAVVFWPLPLVLAFLRVRF